MLLRLPLPTAEVVAEAAAVGADCIRVLRLFAGAGVVEDCVVDAGGQPVLLARTPTLSTRKPPPGRLLRLHEHVFLRPRAFGWVMQCPGVAATIHVFAPTVDVMRFAAPAAADELGETGALLLDEGILVCDAFGNGPGGIEFHDAVFHAASTRGELTDDGYGARLRPRTRSGTRRRTRPDRPAGAGSRVDLPGPVDVQTPPLHEVLETRRSCREFRPDAVGTRTVSELLGLALRTRSRHPRARDCVLHAYPSAGGLDEITTIVASAYPEPTLGLYLQEQHSLLPVESSRISASDVISVLCRPCGVSSPLPALGLVFVADYDRMASKYASIAYANILRDVGAIYQTVSLVATAMGLGACAVGGGWADLERMGLTDLLGGRLIVGAMVVGSPRAES